LENGYTPIYLNDNPSQYEKPVIITFDDGYEDNYTNVYPILEKYNVKATIFIFTDAVNTPGYLTATQIRSMPLVSFQSHTVTHRKLTELRKDEIRYELAASQDILSRMTGKEVYAICYPVGKFNDTVLDLASDYYSCGVTIMEGVESTILDNYLIVRVFVSRDDALADFKRALVYGT
jgi:peptidoglycan/xylan/chitin deacetylase (PgdA/CDA1 family)